jgi:hypothetical protein
MALPFLAAGMCLGAENYGARAELLSPEGKRNTSSITVSLDRVLTDDERTALVGAFLSGDVRYTKKALANQESLGYVDRGKVKLAIKFAISRTMGKGKQLTMVCAEPMLYIGGDIPDLEPRAGFDFALVVLSVNEDGMGTGEIAPLAKLKVGDERTIIVADYGSPVIDLEDVTREK